MNLLLKFNVAYSNLTDKWLPLWLDKFIDHNAGGFFERLDSDCRALDMGYRRLLTQCRQMYVFSHAYRLTTNKDFLIAAQKGYALINDAFRAVNGDGFHFSITADGSIHDITYDLYGHAFVLFSLAHYYEASKDITAIALAKRTLEFINSHFKVAAQNGYHEALAYNLDPIIKVRRQNPHMHLFEGCLAMYSITQDKDYLSTADDILNLFQQHFFDENTATLGEFFDENLSSHASFGHIIEPGHHFEWVWLLYKRLSITASLVESEKIKLIMNKLFYWARHNGIDSSYGGIYNEVDRNGVLLNANKRIWILTEAIKAYSVMLLYDTNMYETLNKELSNLFDIFTTHYMNHDGTWIEICNRDLSPQTDYLPGSTTYHIFSGIVEAYSLLNLQAENCNP